MKNKVKLLFNSCHFAPVPPSVSTTDLLVIPHHSWHIFAPCPQASSPSHNAVILGGFNKVTDMRFWRPPSNMHPTNFPQKTLSSSPRPLTPPHAQSSSVRAIVLHLFVCYLISQVPHYSKFHERWGHICLSAVLFPTPTTHNDVSSVST